jgi:osmotically-inducible protein OsmY
MRLVQPFPDPGQDRDDDPDEVLVDLVVGRLIATAEVRGRDVCVSVQNGVVIMEGYVDSAESKTAAGTLAWSVPGVTDVCNVLAVDSVLG